MCEDAGFDSPYDAVQSYIDALNAGDVSAMLSTFAIETYVDNMDAAEAIDRIRSINASAYYTVPVVGPSLRSRCGSLFVSFTIDRKRQNLSIISICVAPGVASSCLMVMLWIPVSVMSIASDAVR